MPALGLFHLQNAASYLEKASYYVIIRKTLEKGGPAMIKDKNFGELLHELREERNVTLEMLGAGLCDVGKLSRIENGKVEAGRI